MTQSISKQAKALANRAGVKTSVRSYGNSVRVVFMSEPTQALVDAMDALSTSEAHGDLMNDTRYYTGVSIHFSFNYEIPAETMAQVEAIRAQYAQAGYHFEQAVKAQLGARGQAVLDKVRFS